MNKDCPVQRNHDSKRSLKSWIVAWAVLLISAQIGVKAVAQQGSNQPYQVHAIRFASPDSVAEVLGRMLADYRPQVNIRADVPGQRILIAGPTPAQELAARIVASLDQPGPANSNRPELRTYTARVNNLDELASQLQSRFPENGGVRVTMDRRLGQILVLAPPTIHDELVRQWRLEPVGNWANRETARNAETTDSGPRVRKSLRLQHRRFQELEPRLVQLWGRPRNVKKFQGGQILQMQFRPADATPIWVQVDLAQDSWVLEGEQAQVEGWMRVLERMDRPASAPGQMRVVSLGKADRLSVRQALDTFVRGQGPAEPISGQAVKPGTISPLMAKIFGGKSSSPPARNLSGVRLAQRDPQEETLEDGTEQPPLEEEPVLPAGLVGDVRIEFLEGLDVILIEGREADVARVQQIIDDIERLSAETAPVVEVVYLKHVDSTALATLVREVYTEVFEPRLGAVSITELVNPNALLLIGRSENLEGVKDLVNRLDQPVSRDDQFRIFRLKNNAAADVQTMVEDFFADPQALGPKVLVASDFRTNSLIVRASPRDMLEVQMLIEQIDSESSGAVHQFRIFQLQNSRVEELAPILQDAIVGEAAASSGNRTTTNQFFPGQPQGQQPQRPASAGGAQTKSTSVELTVIDREGQRVLRSGILSDVRISADPRSNSLLVNAPARSMELIEALVKQLDQPPMAQMQIKVYEVIEGDAVAISAMLQELFGVQAGQTQNQGIFTTIGGDAEGAVIPMRFTVDERTNSIIVAGSSNDLLVVESILLNLDSNNVRERKNEVFRLMNAPADLVAESITLWLQSEREIRLSATDTATSAFQQMEQEVVVVPEIVSNSLIISATPRYFDDIVRIIKDLDERPPLVAIQVLIAEVELSNVDEFGAEFGIQDSVLFDRSLIGVPEFITVLDTLTVNQTQTTNERIVSASNIPGYNFNNQPLGNSASDVALARSNVVGTQGLTNFSVGRTNNDLGYGGFVFSAGSESVNILLRALQQCRKLEILARPQVTTLNNIEAFVQVGERIPRVTGTTTTTAGQVVATVDSELENVGVIMLVTPRVSRDGMVVLELEAERSNRSPEGVPIATGIDGIPVESPIIDVSRISTTVSALSGQTIVVGGLINKDRIDESRRVPYLSDIPLLGNLFRFDASEVRRTELLIIMTPHVIKGVEDMEILKQIESSRMSWCMSDVIDIHGDGSLRTRMDEWDDSETEVIYPAEIEGYSETPNAAETAPNMMVPGEVVPQGFWRGPQGPVPAGQPVVTPNNLPPAAQAGVQPVQWQANPARHAVPPRAAAPRVSPPSAGRAPAPGRAPVGPPLPARTPG